MVEHITDEELIALKAAADAADEAVRALLERDIDQGRFGPRLRAAGYIGTYVVPPVLSWESLNELVRDKTYDVNFSVTQYPDFDGAIANYFQSDQFINPLNSHYEKWEELRHNLAVVRNYLLIEYFEKNPKGLSEKDVEGKLEQIAEYIGRGLYNNYRFLGLVPNHNPLEPFVDIFKASAPDGEGARYIYERILQKDRNSGWLRPFNPIIEFFSGETIANWHLPDLHETPFYPGYEELVAPDIVTDAMVMQAIEESRRLKKLLSEAYKMRDQQTFVKNASNDLDGLGNQLLFSAASAHHVTGLQEPVRRNAIEIAKDILNKLKVQLGNVNIKEGLNLNPEDDVAAIGAVKGVMLVYEKMLAHARHVDASILNHPAVVAATQAFGHIGYLAKKEALRFSALSKDEMQTQLLAGQLARIPEFFSQSDYTRFGELITRIETGFEVVLNRLQQISGPAALISNSQFDTVGTSMDTPLAGMQAQMAAAIGVYGNAQAAQANQAANQNAQMQAQQILRDQAKKSGDAQTNVKGTGRAALAQAKKSASAQSLDTPQGAAIVGSQAARKQQALGNPSIVVDPQKLQRITQGINPLVLQAMRRAQVQAARRVSGPLQHHDHHDEHHQEHHHEHEEQHGAGGLRPAATPGKSNKNAHSHGEQHDEHTNAGDSHAAELERERKKHHSTVPGGRSF